MKVLHTQGMVAGILILSVFFGGVAYALTNEEERAELERQLSELEEQIIQQEAEVQDLGSQGKSLQSEISRLRAKEDVLNLKIKAITGQLQQLGTEIVEKGVEIQGTEEKIVFNKEALKEALQVVYENGQSSLIEVLLRNPNLSLFFGDINDLLAVQNNLVATIDKISILKDELLEEREVLGLKKNDTEALKEYQARQRTDIALTQKEKDNLLKVTKGKEAEYKKILSETKKNASEIRSRIFTLLGGGQLSFEAAYDLAKLAEGATGVRAALILAVLDHESALGRNVGQCGYKTAMHPTRDIPVFLEIVGELGINPDAIKVSCANSDGAYGGAMGPAQFIPSTWKLYKKDITAITGNKPPSPWDNSDAFAATASYLSDSLNSSGCRNYADKYDYLLPHQMLQERCAAAKYYAGGRWFTYRFAYGDPVVEKADSFQADIDFLNS